MVRADFEGGGAKGVEGVGWLSSKKVVERLGRPRREVVGDTGCGGWAACAACAIVLCLPLCSHTQPVRDSSAPSACMAFPILYILMQQQQQTSCMLVKERL